MKKNFIPSNSWPFIVNFSQKFSGYLYEGSTQQLWLWRSTLTWWPRWRSKRPWERSKLEIPGAPLLHQPLQIAQQPVLIPGVIMLMSKLLKYLTCLTFPAPTPFGKVQDCLCHIRIRCGRSYSEFGCDMQDEVMNVNEVMIWHLLFDNWTFLAV